jgi:hypothetical protein
MSELAEDVCDISKTLKAIADGYDYTMHLSDDGESTRILILVENPDFDPTNGSNPFTSFYVTTY